MKKVTLFIMVLLTASLLVAQGAGRGQGQGKGGKKMKGRQNHGMQMILNDRLLEDAGVSEKMRADIRKKKHEVKQKIGNFHFKIKELRVSSRKEMKKDRPNIKLLRSNAQKTAELQKKAMLLMSNFRIDVLTKLTPEQRKKIVERMKERRNQLMHRMGNGNR
ncbi:hypothetical protein KAH37_07030 [bacterium]|nr:hypothetical protein [bacterium]